jgi:hypothetical protein
MSPFLKNGRQFLISLIYFYWPVVLGVVIVFLGAGLWFRSNSLKMKAEAEARERANADAAAAALKKTNDDGIDHEKKEQDLFARRDATKTRVFPSLSDITNRSYVFFMGGRAVIGYVRGSDGRIEFWSQPQGKHPVTNQPILPVTPEIVVEYQADLRKQIEMENEEIAKAKDKSNQLAKIKAESETKADAEAREKDRLTGKAEAERIASETRRAAQTKYLWPVDASDVPSQPRVAVLVAYQNQPDMALAEAVSRMARRSGFFAVDNLFKAEFISDGLFDKVFNGEQDSINELGLTKRCEYLAFCQMKSTLQLLPDFNNLKVVTGKLKIRLFRTGVGSLLSSQEYEADSKNFDPSTAIPFVQKQLINQLATNSFLLQSAVK